VEETNWLIFIHTNYDDIASPKVIYVTLQPVFSSSALIYFIFHKFPLFHNITVTHIYNRHCMFSLEHILPEGATTWILSSVTPAFCQTGFNMTSFSTSVLVKFLHNCEVSVSHSIFYKLLHIPYPGSRAVKLTDKANFLSLLMPILLFCERLLHSVSRYRLEVYKPKVVSFNYYIDMHAYLATPKHACTSIFYLLSGHSESCTCVG
jgi:hypothetical protein